MITVQQLRKTAESVKNDLEQGGFDSDDLRCDYEDLLNLCLVVLGAEVNALAVLLECVEIREADGVSLEHDDQ